MPVIDDRFENIKKGSMKGVRKGDWRKETRKVTRIPSPMSTTIKIVTDSRRPDIRCYETVHDILSVTLDVQQRKRKINMFEIESAVTT